MLTALTSVLVLSGTTLAVAAQKATLVLNTSHVTGGVDHGLIVSSDAHAHTGHAHAGKNAYLYRHGVTICAVGGNSAHVHCASETGGVYGSNHSVNGETDAGRLNVSACRWGEDIPTIAYADGHGMCGHGAGPELLRALTHDPPAGLVAGDPVTLTVEASAPCQSPCTGETATLHYKDATGEWQEMVPASTSSTSYEFDVPGDLVRYPSFEYYVSVNRTMSDGSVRSLRLPQELSFGVEVENLLRLTFVDPTGRETPIEWRIEAVDITGASPPRVVLEGRSSADGALEVAIPDDGPISSAAMNNRGVANLLITGGTVDAANDVVYHGIGGFQANLGAADAPAGVYSTSITGGEASDLVALKGLPCDQTFDGAPNCVDVPDALACMAKNDDPTADPPRHDYHRHGTEQGPLWDISFGYRMDVEVEMGQGKLVQNAVGLAAAYGRGPWEPIEAAFEVRHSSNDGIGRIHRFGRVQTSRALVKIVRTWWEMYHDGLWAPVRAYPEDPANPTVKCVYSQRQYPGPWNTSGRTNPIDDGHTPHREWMPHFSPHNDCADTCAAPPECGQCAPTWELVDNDNPWYHVSGKGHGQSGGFCAFICVGSAANHETYQRLSYTGGACAAGYKVYFLPGETWATAPVFYVDSGFLGGASVNGVPAGC